MSKIYNLVQVLFSINENIISITTWQSNCKKKAIKMQNVFALQLIKGSRAVKSFYSDIDLLKYWKLKTRRVFFYFWAVTEWFSEAQMLMRKTQENDRTRKLWVNSLIVRVFRTFTLHRLFNWINSNELRRLASCTSRLHRSRIWKSRCWAENTRISAWINLSTGDFSSFASGLGFNMFLNNWYYITFDSKWRPNI